LTKKVDIKLNFRHKLLALDEKSSNFHGEEEKA